METKTAGETEETFFASELRSALVEYRRVHGEICRLSVERNRKARLVKGLLAVLRLKGDDASLLALLQRHGLVELARPFLTRSRTGSLPQGPATRNGGRHDRKPVDPAGVLTKGTRIRMLSGAYADFTGVVASIQARSGRRGLDVTYFLTLSGPDGARKRTSVKHGTLGRTWAVAES